MSGASDTARARHKFWTKRRCVCLAVAVVLLPVAYLLLAGPFLYFAERGYLPKRILNIGGYPIEWAGEHGVYKLFGAEDTVKAYYNWWREKARKQ